MDRQNFGDLIVGDRLDRLDSSAQLDRLDRLGQTYAVEIFVLPVS